MAIKTQGTELFVYDPTTDLVTNVGCVTSIDGIDSTIAQVDTTCLNDLARTSVGGLAEPGQAAFEIQFDPDNPDHIKLHQAKTATKELLWFVGFRHEVNGIPQVPGPVPTIEDGIPVLPPERAWVTFYGFIQNFPLNFAQNEVVRSPLTVQISGDPLVIPRNQPDPTPPSP